MKEYYTQPGTGYRHTIERAENGRYFIGYSIDKSGHSSCTCGPFATIEEARETLHKHRPGAELLNSMCGQCATFGHDCTGTSCQTWTGCIWRTR